MDIKKLETKEVNENLKPRVKRYSRKQIQEGGNRIIFQLGIEGPNDDRVGIGFIRP